MFFNNIQAMRGIASLIVFIHHLFNMRPSMTPSWLERGFYAVGPAGVDIFFVISGFVVTLSAFKTSGKPSPRKESVIFMLKRIARVYPTYWVVLAIAFIISPPVWLSPEWLPHTSLAHLLTLTDTCNYKVMVAWTLVYEMFFYLVLSILIMFGRKNFFQVLFWWIFIEILAIALFNIHDKNFASYVPLNPQIIQFSAGCVVAFIVKELKPAYGKEILLGGIIMFFAMCYVNITMANWSPWARTLTLTLPCAMMIYGACVSEMQGTFKFKAPILWLGNISFSLYLWHHITFETMGYVFDKLHLTTSLPNFLSLAIWSACAITMAYLSHNFIEKPSYKIIGGAIDRLFKTKSLTEAKIDTPAT